MQNPVADADSRAKFCYNITKEHKDIIFVAVYSLVFIAGLILNLMAIVVFFCQTKSRSHTTVYMTNLAVADLFLVCTLPFRIYYHSFKSPAQRICDIAGLILLANMYGSIFLLTCVCLDRCLAVCFPMSSRIQEARKKAPLVCVGIWILSLGASLPVYLGGGHLRNETGQCFRSFPLYATQTAALISSLVIGYGIPLVIMIVCSWGLVRAINKSTAAQTDSLVNSSKIQKMVSTNLVIFLVCFLPYHVILGMIHSYKNRVKEIPCPVISAYQYSLMIACLNASLDPLTYYFTTETFRKKVDMDVVWRLWPLNSHSSDGNNRSRAPLNT
ncbi:lysophosphatidic acid receptor 6 [Astyanax mexicanus]|uniref:lysophosphatidic acid receptor 6 n=1 Tax=Astyanax mexicanus TaxID=7994 RepID=UPI0020CAD1EE|nr:lysophosphatidic acid receptor 6 [Astyanax mexicanus]